MNWWQMVIEIGGFFLYLYLSWRILRENYKEEDVVAFSWVTLFVFLIASRVTYGLVNWGVWNDIPIKWLEFWKIDQSLVLGGYGLWLLLAWLVTTDRGWRYWAFAEDNTPLISWIILIFSLVNREWLTIGGLGLVFIIYLFLKGRYRSFTWYRSGKKGFLFFLGNMIFFTYISVITGIYWWMIPVLICGGGLVMLGNDKLS